MDLPLIWIDSSFILPNPKDANTLSGRRQGSYLMSLSIEQTEGRTEVHNLLNLCPGLKYESLEGSFMQRELSYNLR